MSREELDIELHAPQEFSRPSLSEPGGREGGGGGRERGRPVILYRLLANMLLRGTGKWIAQSWPRPSKQPLRLAPRPQLPLCPSVRTVDVVYALYHVSSFVFPLSSSCSWSSLAATCETRLGTGIGAIIWGSTRPVPCALGRISFQWSIPRPHTMVAKVSSVIKLSGF